MLFLRTYKMKLLVLAAMLLAVVFIIIGCGAEDHSPTVRCLNFGVENVRRNLHIIASVDVGRKPLYGVSSETVKLIILPQEVPVPGDVYYSGDRIAFIPYTKLQDSTEYRFEIDGDIEDASGEKMQSMKQTFWTGNVLQVYYVDLLRSYNSTDGEVNSIGIYFSEGVDSTSLPMNITVLEDDWTNQFFDVVYYSEVALAVLIFSYPLELNKNYTLSISANLLSATDTGNLDGDRDGEDVDYDPFILNFRYESDPVEGIIVADSSTNAAEYYEPTERCFLYEFGI